MGQRIQNFVQSVKDLLAMPPVAIDGALYVLIAYFGAASAALSTDEAAKHVTEHWLFWIRVFHNVGGAMTLALKMFRSTAFSDSKPKTLVTNSAGETELVSKKND